MLFTIRRGRRCPFLCLGLLFLITGVTRAQNIPSPKEHFGFSIGDNYQLATFTQTAAYFKKLAAASDRARLLEIGKTEEGRSQFMMIVTSPENLQKLDHYKSLSCQLAHAEGLTDEQAHAMAAEGKAVVWIDGGLHATEVVATHQLIETAYQLLSRKDPETMRILDNVIILLTQVNPDGQELVSNWYMRESRPERRSLEGVPVLYEKYAGHDNNRDFFMMNLKETQNIGRQLFVEWLPQIMYNHHQAGPAGSILAGPPYRDPFNYVFDPLIITSIDAVGAAMNNRLNVEGKPGYTQRGGSSFSTWYNGGLRTTTYFHNMIGLLTEIIGGPNPSDVPLIPQRLLPNGATPNPVTPQKWYFRQSIDYSVSLNYAVLDYAVRYRDELLYNIYKMGRNSIERGERDNWTLSPKRIAEISQLYADAPKPGGAAGGRQGRGARGNAGQAGATAGQDAAQANKTSGRPGAGQAGAAGADSSQARTDSSSGERPDPNAIPAKYFDSVMKNPALRDPRGYIIPSNQPDLPTAVWFLNALIRTGVLVHTATADFTVAGKTYPKGSYIVKTNQAFRPHVLDMFEPQDHPNDFLYPGGPPVAPYDAAGWTLAFQMGVQFDRILDGFDGPFERVPYGELLSVTGHINNGASAKGYWLDARANQSYTAANDLLKEGIDVYRMPATGTTSAATSADARAAVGKDASPGPGTFYIPASSKAKSILEKETATLGINVGTLDRRPTTLSPLKPARIALWDNYGGSIPSGWERYIMEQYHFPVTILYPKDIDAGNLRSKYDVILFVTSAIPPVSTETGGRGGFRGRGEPKPEEIPAEYRPRLGRITVEKSIPELRKFLEAGGHIVTIGSSCSLAFHLGLPVRDALMELNNGKEKKLPGEKFYIPGSLLRVSVDSSSQPGWGMGGNADVYFDESPVFTITPDAYSKGVIKPIAWFANNKPLRSGWAWGQAYLQDGVAAFVASVGQGKLYAFGPEITFRAQTYGTFKFLFNQLYVMPEPK